MMRWGILARGGRRKACDRPTTLIDHVAILEDPRDPSKCRRKLIDMVVIAIAVVLRCGVVNSEAFGRAKIAWCRRFLDLGNGSPLTIP